MRVFDSRVSKAKLLQNLYEKYGFAHKNFTVVSYIEDNRRENSLIPKKKENYHENSENIFNGFGDGRIFVAEHNWHGRGEE